jgi:Bacterial SH3 domain
MGKAVFEGVLARRAKLIANGIGLRNSCAAVLSLLFLCGLGFTRTRETGAASFSIDLDKPFTEVVNAVGEVARSGSIKGTFEYKGDEQLNDAQFAEKSQLFPAWTDRGKVFFKVRTKALSPAHFLNSNDVGTVAVRYVVQERGPSSTRLFIDAVFIENARHHGHPSDGYVETCEFGEIGKRLKDREQLQKQVAADQQFSPGQESSSRSDAGQAEARQVGAKPDVPQAEAKRAEVVDLAKVGELQRAIGEQKSLLASESANLDKLEAQARQLRASEFVRVKSERAELKALPYGHARVVEALKKGQEVTVLAKSTYWYQVRSEDGKEGWISHTLLEVQP